MLPSGNLIPLLRRIKKITEISEARDDVDFQPVGWTFLPQDEDMDVDEEGYLRDGRGVIVREGELPEKFQTKYIGSSAKSGTKVKGILTIIKLMCL